MPHLSLREVSQAWSQERIAAPLAALAAAQLPDGTWKDEGTTDDATALVAIAFMYAIYSGIHTPAPRDLYPQTLSAAVAALVRADPRSSGTRARAVRSAALTEALGCTRAPALREACALAVADLMSLRLCGGGWPAEPGGALDWSSTTMAISALKGAMGEGLDPGVTVKELTAWWLDHVGDGTGDDLDALIWKVASITPFYHGPAVMPRAMALVHQLAARATTRSLTLREDLACSKAFFVAGGLIWPAWRRRCQAVPLPRDDAGAQATRLRIDRMVDHTLAQDADRGEESG